MEIAGAHKLDLPYASACNRIHGHNWIIEVEISCETLNISGMIVDFSSLKDAMKEVIKEKLDHQNLNEALAMTNPTAEMMAKWIAQQMQNRMLDLADLYPPKSLPFVSKVTVQESEGNKACYIP